MPAFLAVVAAFMAGMAIGAWWISKRALRRPAKWYGWLEIAIGLWACATTALVPIANGAALKWIGVQPSVAWHWFVAFAVPFVVLLPATAAMGATLPVIERFVTPLTRSGRSVGALYAANTLGAVTGVLCSTFLILPRLGLRRALFIFATVNLACGFIALLARDRRGDIILLRKDATAPRRLWATLFVTGLLGVGYEVVGVRVLAQVLEGTVYSYAAILAIFLLGTSLGAAVCDRAGQRWRLTDLLCATALACVAGIFAATAADDLYRACRHQFGTTVAGTLLAEMIVAGAVFLLPTMAMGATFSHLAQWAATARSGLGRAVAMNTVGAALAPLIFSVVLLPSVGGKWAWSIAAAGYLLVLPTVRGWRWAPVLLVPVLLLALPAQLRFVTVPAGGRVIEFRDGVMASVAVVEDVTQHRSLRVDNRFQMGGTGVADAEYRHAHFPLLLHPAPRRALFLGLGTGITLGASALHEVLADGVELLPEVAAVMPQFSPYNDAVRTNERVRVCVADARRIVQAATNAYDIVVGDLFHPARDGAGSLYTLEHFKSIRQKLAPGGLFCQWLPLHQIDTEMFRVITRTFLTVFPDTQAWLLRFNVDAPVVALLGRTSPIAYSTNWLETRVESPLLAERLQRLALGDSLRLLGNLLAGPAELESFARSARLNTDDNSAVLFGAPAFTYREDAKPYGTLLAVLNVQPANPAAVLGLDSPALNSFMSARNVFLRGLIDEAEGRLDAAFARYVESARISADFTAGYARVITAATAEAKANPSRSRKLLEQLSEAQPSRPVAKQLLEKLFP
jgi:spermidine synthase